jgi:hypothetical protein
VFILNFEKEVKSGYKICRIYPDGTFVSCTECGKVLKYNKNGRTYHKLGNGAIAVFKNRETAIDFWRHEMNYHHPKVILPVKYRPSKIRELSYSYPRTYHKRGRYIQELMREHQTPMGTDFATWVKIISE